MCAQRKKWSVENFQFSETDFSRPVQRFANHWQEGSGERMLSSPRAVRQRSENTTNPSHRIMLVRATTKRSKPSDTCAKSTHPPFQSGSCRVCAISHVRDREDWRACRVRVRAPAGVCQRRASSAAEPTVPRGTSLVLWLGFFCSLRISRPALLVSPLCKPASHQRAPFFSLSRRLTLLCFVVPSREAIWPRSMRQSSGCSPFSPPCFVL